MTAPDRAMADVDKVAEAMKAADKIPATSSQHRCSDDRYRRMAVAAVDALGLTEEWRTTGWLGPVSESLARKQAETEGTLQRRLVSEWTPAPHQQEKTQQ